MRRLDGELTLSHCRSRNKKKNYVQELEQQIAQLKAENDRLRNGSTAAVISAPVSADGNTVDPSRIQQQSTSSTASVDQLMLENIQLRAKVDGLEGVVKSLVGLLGGAADMTRSATPQAASPSHASSPTAISDALDPMSTPQRPLASSPSLVSQSKDLACHPAAMVTRLSMTTPCVPSSLPARFDSAALARLYALSGQQAGAAESNLAARVSEGSAAETVVAIRALQRAISSDSKTKTMASAQGGSSAATSRRERVLSWRSQIPTLAPTWTTIPAC